MISLEKLCKTYHPNGSVTVHELNNVSLDLPETSMVFIIGKSGSGKSTFLNRHAPFGADYRSKCREHIHDRLPAYNAQIQQEAY